jgi:hypothetical protein
LPTNPVGACDPIEERRAEQAGRRVEQPGDHEELGVGEPGAARIGFDHSVKKHDKLAQASSEWLISS